MLDKSPIDWTRHNPHYRFPSQSLCFHEEVVMSSPLSPEEMSFDRQLKKLDEVLSMADKSAQEVLIRVRTSAVRIREELKHIVTATGQPYGHHVSCFDCGRKKLELFYTSKQGSYHLCPTCFHRRERCGRAKSQDASSHS